MLVTLAILLVAASLAEQAPLYAAAAALGGFGLALWRYITAGRKDEKVDRQSKIIGDLDVLIEEFKDQRDSERTEYRAQINELREAARRDRDDRAVERQQWVDERQRMLDAVRKEREEWAKERTAMGMVIGKLNDGRESMEFTLATHSDRMAALTVALDLAEKRMREEGEAA